MAEPRNRIARIDAELEEIIPEFFRITRLEIEELRDALSNVDYELLKRMGHSIKGACLGYGFKEMSNFGRAIEDAAAKQEDPANITRIIEEYASYVETVKVIYV